MIAIVNWFHFQLSLASVSDSMELLNAAFPTQASNSDILRTIARVITTPEGSIDFFFLIDDLRFDVM
jgi:hypothetical protein